MTQEVLKLSQEALAGLKDVEKQVRELVAENKALKEALAQTQEPVAWPCLIDSADFSENTITLVMQCEDYKVSAGTHWLSTTPQQRTEQEPFCLHWEDRWGCNHYADPKEPHPVNAKHLYTTPPQRTWVGLTDEDKKQIAKEANYHWEMTAGEYAERIGQLTEAKLKQKNGYAEENT